MLKCFSFRPLSRGLFFNSVEETPIDYDEFDVFVPFLGDFFSIHNHISFAKMIELSFRPLSRGLFFNFRYYQS